MMTLLPRFGRNYSSAREAETLFLSGAFFLDTTVDPPAPVNVSDLRARGIRRVSLIFAIGRDPVLVDI